MASVPGPSSSGTSGALGNQPPNKRSKMNTDNPSNPESDQNSLDSKQPGSISVSSVTQMQLEDLKCPVCRDYPRMEVYQCDDSHIVCHECIAKMTRCPVCRANYPPKKIRNRVAENVLEGMTFDCTFKNDGCLKTCIPRNQRTSHDMQCKYNPTPPGVVCCLFEKTCTEICNFRIKPYSVIQDAQYTRDLIEHLKSPPHNLNHEKIRIGDKKILRRCLLTPWNDPYLKPLVVFQVINPTTRNTTGYYVLIQRYQVPSRDKLSWAVVGLNFSPGGVNGGNRHSDKIRVTFSMEAKMNKKKVAKDGVGCVPNLSWRIKSMYLNDWEDFMKTPKENRPLFSFSVPRNFVEDYYTHSDGKYQLAVSFGH